MNGEAQSDHRTCLLMKHPPYQKLAELNLGSILVPSDDPRAADFMNALDRSNGLGKRMRSCVWMI